MLTGIAPAEAAVCSPSSAPNSSNSAITVLTFTTVTTCDWQVPSGVSEISLVVVGGGGEVAPTVVWEGEVMGADE